MHERLLRLKWLQWSRGLHCRHPLCPGCRQDMSLSSAHVSHTGDSSSADGGKAACD